LEFEGLLNNAIARQTEIFGNFISYYFAALRCAPMDRQINISVNNTAR
jgi:hypothetical protein